MATFAVKKVRVHYIEKVSASVVLCRVPVPTTSKSE
ncbi:unnamed protein product, partial [Acanthoscelides obtectus]